MSFLPDDYRPPSSSNHYLKLQNGTNKLRILSRPLIGWEVWSEGRPVRSKEKMDPVGESNPREFWAMVVWSYESEKIQIWHVTQGSIKKSIRDLSQDETWGSPSGYDLRIVREGHQLKTNYSVTPCPKIPIAEQVKSAFKESPCWLEAILKNDDPFADGRSVEPLWDMESVSDTITGVQYDQIAGLIGDDFDYLKKVSQGVQSHYKVDSLRQLPSSAFDKVLGQVKLYAKERVEKEMSKMEDELPF